MFWRSCNKGDSFELNRIVLFLVELNFLVCKQHLAEVRTIFLDTSSFPMEHAQQTYEIVSCLFTPCTNLKVSAAPDGVCNPIKRKTEKVRKRREPSAAEIGWPWPNKCQWHRFFGIIHREMVFPRQWQPGCPPPSHFCMDPSDSLLCWLREVAQLLPHSFCIGAYG